MKTPEAIGPYSKAVFAGDLLFCSGQIPLNPETMQIVEGGIEEQTKQACENISDLLIKFGLKIENVVKTTIFLRNIGDFGIVNNIYGSYFITKPARSTIEVSNLPKGALLEIEVIAKK